MKPAPHIFLVKHMQGSLVSPVKPEGPRSRAWDTPDTKQTSDPYNAAEFLWYEKNLSHRRAGADPMATELVNLHEMVSRGTQTSKGEEEFASHLKAVGIEYKREYRFHPERKWRFDFAFPEHKIAVEIEGGVWSHGRHTRGSGFVKDCDKYNAAAILGWRVLRFTPTEHVRTGLAIEAVEHILGEPIREHR